MSGWFPGKLDEDGEPLLPLAIWDADPETMRPYSADTVAPNVVAMVESRICASTKMRHLHGGKKLIPRWNDAPGRTVDEVIAMLQAVADELRKGAREFPFHYRDYTGRLVCS